jgi:hypothetical protein
VRDVEKNCCGLCEHFLAGRKAENLIRTTDLLPHTTKIWIVYIFQVGTGILSSELCVNILYLLLLPYLYVHAALIWQSSYMCTGILLACDCTQYYLLAALRSCMFFFHPYFKTFDVSFESHVM